MSFSIANRPSNATHQATLATTRQVRAGSGGKRLDDDFRVGSYVVHSPPMASPGGSGGRYVAAPACSPGGSLGTPASHRQQRDTALLDETTVITPRLPRGVSRIPHRVQAGNNAGHANNYYQQQESSIEAFIGDSSSKYLTFNKDQATSHFESLKEELSAAAGDKKRREVREDQQHQEPRPEPQPDLEQRLEPESQSESQSYLEPEPELQSHSKPEVESEPEPKVSQLQVAKNNNNITTINNHKYPSPVERQKIKHYNNTKQTNPVLIKTSEDNDHHNGFPISAPTNRPQLATTTNINAANNSRQQPVCEAFIMTGQSMLKLSCNESEQNRNNSGNNNNNNVNINNNININNTNVAKPKATNESHLDQVDCEPKLKSLSMNKLNSGANSGISCTSSPSSTHTFTATSSTTTTTSTSISTSSSASSSTLPTCNDRDSARRLAKRLYNLSGFKRSDVRHHLTRNNPFSQMVLEEYMNLFDCKSMSLDDALRFFLVKIMLDGETQEREGILAAFSKRYYDCNKDKFPSADVVQTLVCALILLNTDLRGGYNKKRSKLGLGAFVDGINSSMAALTHSSGSPSRQTSAGSQGVEESVRNNQVPYTVSRRLLVDLYESIKKRPLRYSYDKCDKTSFEAELDKICGQQMSSGGRSNTLPTRRFAPGSNAPSSTLNASARRHLKQGLNKLGVSGQLGDAENETAIQFRSGYLSRKRIFEAQGRPTSKGRRSWRRAYVVLQDLRLTARSGPINEDLKQHDNNDKKTAKQKAKQRAQALALEMKNTIKIHHTFAKRSTTYTKREFVFHLRLADQSEYLVQANDEDDMSVWIDTINFASACLSSPALPSAVSNTKQLQWRTRRPLLPASYTKLSYWEQLIDHEERLQRLKVELDEHLSEAPNTKNANKRFQTEFIEKIAYLKQEIERYTVYVDLMRKKSNSPEAIILSKHPQIASLKPSNEMILSLPSFAPPHLLLTASKEEFNEGGGDSGA